MSFDEDVILLLLLCRSYDVIFVALEANGSLFCKFYLRESGRKFEDNNLII